MVVDVQGKIFETWVDEIIFILELTPSLTFSQELAPTLTLVLSLGLGLGLALGHFQNKDFFFLNV